MTERYRTLIIPFAVLVFAGFTTLGPVIPAGTTVGTEGDPSTITSAPGATPPGSLPGDTPEPAAEVISNRVAADTQHSCIIDSGGQAWCWGRAGYGKLGQGKALAANLATPRRVVQGELEFVSIAAGMNHTCALDTTGAAHCWGSAGRGRLGTDETRGNFPTPQAVLGGHKFIQITAGRQFTCALSEDQEAYCWGANANTYSPLGVGSGGNANRSIPTPVVGGHRFTWISAAKYHACGITTTGETYCWGAGSNGRLGTGASRGTLEPTLVEGGHTFVRVAGGNNHTCALTAEGEAWCWGLSAYGRLGAVDEAGKRIAARSVDRPVRVSTDLRFADIQGGQYHTCALGTDSRIYCWGSQIRGKIGNGKTSAGNVLVPNEVAGGHEFIDLGVGLDHNCAMTAAGETYCWGRGDNGQIGNGSLENVGTPARVSFTTS